MHPNERGTMIHEAAELYVRGTGQYIPELRKFIPEFDSLRELYKAGMVSLEGEWAMSKNWEPMPWQGQWLEAPKGTPHNKTAKILPERGKDDDIIKVGKQVWIWEPAWLRLKLDAIVFLSETEAVVIDYKSGKRFGNEITHAEQTQLYQLVAFIRYPKLEIIHTELWYLDIDELICQTFLRHQGMRFLNSFTKKGLAITECVDFPPNPSLFVCTYCPYGPWGTNHCTRGVKNGYP